MNLVKMKFTLTYESFHYILIAMNKIQMVFFFFYGHTVRHMEVPRLAVTLELQLPTLPQSLQCQIPAASVT